MSVFIFTLTRKHLDKVYKDIGATRGPTCIKSVLGRIFSKIEKGGEKTVRPPSRTTCSGDFSLGMSWMALGTSWVVSWLMQPTSNMLRAFVN